MSEVKIKTVYKSPSDRQPGAIWKTNRCGEFQIIGKVDDHTGKHYLIKFLNTGFEMVTGGSAFKTGTVRDPMAKLLYGRGYIGVGPYKTSSNCKLTKWGSLWHNMFMRCYDSSYLKRTPSYEGCSVCERWHCFQTFCADLKKLPGYEAWLSNNDYAFDKDILIPGNKEYKPEACQFIYNGDNTRASNKSKNVYEAVSPSGDKFYFRNQRVFAETHGMTKGGISSVVRGDQETHRGWTFRKLTLNEITNIKSELIQD